MHCRLFQGAAAGFLRRPTATSQLELAAEDAAAAFAMAATLARVNIGCVEELGANVATVLAPVGVGAGRTPASQMLVG